MTEPIKIRDLEKERRQASGIPYAVPAPLAYEPAQPSPAVTPQTAARAARRRRRVEAPDETSIAQELLQGGEILGLPYETDDVLDELETNPLLAAIPGVGTSAMRYSPGAVGSSYVDALTFGNEAEIEALARHLVSGDDADTAESNADARNAVLASRNPGSALLGTGAGLATMAAVPLHGRVAPGSGLGGVLRAALPTAAVGAGAGAAYRGLTAEPGDRVSEAFQGAVGGGALGFGAGTLLSSGQALRQASMPWVARLLASPTAGALTGAGIGTLAAPGEAGDMTGPALGPDGPEASWVSRLMGADAGSLAHSAGRGAAFGAVAEPVLGAVGTLAGAMGRRAAPRVAEAAAEDAPAVDETAMMFGEPTSRPTVSPGGALDETAAQITDRIRAENPTNTLLDIARSGIEAPPEYDVLHGLSARGPGNVQSLNQGAAAFGGPEQLARELRSLGLAPQGRMWSRNTERDVAQRLQDQILGRLQATNAAVEAAETPPTEAQRIADAMEAQHARFMSEAPYDLDRQAAAEEILAYGRQFADDVIPELETLTDEAGQPVEAMVEELIPRAPVPFQTIRGEMTDKWRAGREGRISARAGNAQTPRQRVASYIYDGLAPLRNEHYDVALSPAEREIQRGLQRSTMALNAIHPTDLRLDPNSMAQPAQLRGMLSGLAAQSGSAAQGGGFVDQSTSRLAGWLQEQILANYQNSMRAYLNERTLPAMGRMGERLSIAPDTAAAIAQATQGGTAPLTASRFAAERAASAPPTESVDYENDPAAQQREAAFEDSITGGQGIPEPTTPEEEEAQRRFEEWERANMP